MTKSSYTKGQMDSSTKKGKELVYWDDIQTSLVGAKLSPSASPSWRSWDYGVTSGMEFQVLGMDVGNEIYFTVQSFHAMKILSELEMHLHYTTPTNGSGKKFKFQLDVVAAGVNGVWEALVGSPFTSELLMTADFSSTHKIHDLGEIPAVNTTVSTLYKCRLKRIY